MEADKYRAANISANDCKNEESGLAVDKLVSCVDKRLENF